jgi:hypothetical protein
VMSMTDKRRLNWSQSKLQDMIKAIETTATLNDGNRLLLDEKISDTDARKVRVIVLFAESDDVSEQDWRKAAAQNSAFDFLNDAAEDIYTPADGKPFIPNK